jgi:hypothetical protein
MIHQQLMYQLLMFRKCRSLAAHVMKDLQDQLANRALMEMMAQMASRAKTATPAKTVQYLVHPHHVSDNVPLGHQVMQVQLERKDLKDTTENQDKMVNPDNPDQVADQDLEEMQEQKAHRDQKDHQVNLELRNQATLLRGQMDHQEYQDSQVKKAKTEQTENPAAKDQTVHQVIKANLAVLERMVVPVLLVQMVHQERLAAAVIVRHHERHLDIRYCLS